MGSSEKSDDGKLNTSYNSAVYMSPGAWIFHRIDPEDNELRFYYIAVQPSLLDMAGQWSVLRIYGRIGGAQHEMTPMQFDDWEAAKAFAKQLIRARIRRGYMTMPGSPAIPNDI